MSEWESDKLGNIASIVDSLHKTPKKYYDTGYPMVRVTDVKKGTLNLSSTLKVDKDTFTEFSKKHTPKKGDIIFTRVGSYGNSCIVGNETNFCLGQNTVYIIPKIDPYFLYYFLNSPDGKYEIESSVGGSTQPTISLKSIKDYDIPIPPLEEQKAIAEVLSSLDDKIDLLHRQNKTLEELAQTLFRQWFIEEAKDEWEEKPLKEVTKIAIGRTPPRKEFHWFSKNSKDVKWVSIKDMGEDGAFTFDTSEYLTSEAVQTFNVPIIPTNTVLLSFKMTLGRVKITTEPMLSNEAIAHFKFNEKTPFNKEYLYLFLKTYPYQTLGSTSSIVTSINSTMIKEMLIPIPDKNLIADFTKVAEPQFNKIHSNQKQIKTLENMRDTLLPKLMSGEVRVKLNGENNA